MKIYTKKGDKCHTTLVGGVKVSKIHPRIEAYGTVDELIAHIGLLRDMLQTDQCRSSLLHVQDRLMIAAALLASDHSQDIQLPELKDTDVEWLEQSIDKMEEKLQPLTSFILPGGHVAVSQCHICRTVCRRAERRIVELTQSTEIDEVILKYFNRLSDYFFVLARFIAHELKVDEIKWLPGK